MHRLRHLIALRLVVLGLLAGLGLSLVPTAFAAEEGWEQRSSFPDGQVEALTSALASVERPATFEALEASLVQRLGDRQAARALIRVLYGELIRIYRDDLGLHAVFVGGPVAPSGYSGSYAAQDGVARAYQPVGIGSIVSHQAGPVQPTFRVAFPSIQTLGP